MTKLLLCTDLNYTLIANAFDYVKQKANEEESLYIAKGVFPGMNGNYSAGILEVIVHYMPAIEGWLGENDEQ